MGFRVMAVVRKRKRPIQGYGWLLDLVDVWGIGPRRFGFG
jgi:hypothetical protein